MARKSRGAVYYSVTELADMLGYHRNSIIYWIKSGRIRAVRLGMAEKSPYYISQEEADRVMEVLPVPES